MSLKIFQKMLVLSLALFSLSTIAEAGVREQTNEDNNPIAALNVKGQIALGTIKKLEQSGYITKKNAREASASLVFSNKEFFNQHHSVDQKAQNSDIEWTKYLSWINLLKMLGIVSMLIAFRGLVFDFILHLVKIPKNVYQALLITMSLVMTFFPEKIHLEQASYICMFGVIANVILFAWLFETYEKFFLKIFSLFSLNIHPFVVVCFYLSIYFGLFAIQLDSQFLGIFSCIAFVCMFGFIFESSGLHTVIGYSEDDHMGVSLLVNGLITLVFSLVTINEIDLPYVSVFTPGIQYICTIVFSITLLIFSSFVYKEQTGSTFYIVLMIVVEMFSLFAMTFYDLEVIPVIINTAFVLFVFSWVGYITSRVSGILTSFVLGVLLYGLAVFLEKNPELFITALF